MKVEHGEITDKFSTFVNPKVPIPFQITQLTSITDEMVMDSPDILEILPEFLEFVGDATLVAHNASFDVGFIEQKLSISGHCSGIYICGYGGDGKSPATETFKI